MWRVILKSAPRRPAWLFFIVASALISAVGAGVWAALSGPLLKAMMTHSAFTLGPVRIETDHFLQRLPFVIFAVVLVKSLGAAIHAGFANRFVQRFISELKLRLYYNVLYANPKWLSETHSADALMRVTNDMATIESIIAQVFSSATKDTFLLGFYILVCLFLDVKLFFVALAAAPLTFMTIRLFATATRRENLAVQKNLSEAAALASETLRNRGVVQTFGALAHLEEKHEALLAAQLRHAKRSIFLRGTYSPTHELVGVFGIAALLAFSAQKSATSSEHGAHLLSFLAAALLMYQPIKGLSQAYAQFTNGSACVNRIFEFLTLENSAPAPFQSKGDEKEDFAVRFENVSVDYPNNRIGLRQANIEIKKRAFVAFTGQSGAGKSTALNVILNQVVATEGKVLRSFTEMSWLPQEPKMFSGTLEFNLRVANLSATRETLEDALKKVGLFDFVTSLKDGLLTKVDEAGLIFSGGQRQRLVLARALVQDAGLWVLDEPTSALDQESEKCIHACLNALRGKKTIVIAAHHRETIALAEVVYAFDNGEVRCVRNEAS